MSFESHLGSEEKCSGIIINGFSARGYGGGTNSEFRVAFLKNMKKAKLSSQVEDEHSSLIAQTG